MSRLVAVAAVLVMLCAAAPAPPADYEQRLTALARAYTDWTFQENPSSATDAGIHNYDDRLADYSTATQDA